MTAKKRTATKKNPKNAKNPKRVSTEAKTADWPASKIRMRKVSTLTPYARNSKTHPKSQIEKVARSIEEFGWTVPVLIAEDGGIIAGHCRILAAELLEIKTVPVMVATGWTDAQRRAYVIADNRLALDGGWDEDLLKLELKELELGSARAKRKRAATKPDGNRQRH